MTITDTVLQNALRSHWPGAPGEKARRYVGQFYALERVGERISGKVEGNHGTYTVSIWLEGGRVASGCGCYIGKHGFCHHCEALAHTFFNNPAAFPEVIAQEAASLGSLADVENYLKATTLETLLDELKAKGITQKAFAESIGMNPRHLVAIKLACLWAMEHLVKRK